MKYWRMRTGSTIVVGTLITLAVLVPLHRARQEAVADESPVKPSADSHVTIDVRDANIQQVLEAFSKQTGLSVVAGKEVEGTVSLRLLDVQWDHALEAILKPYGFGYQRTGDVIIVLPFGKLSELNATEPVSSRVFKLSYLDGGDLKPVVESQLSPRGQVQVVELTGQKGWDFGAFGAAGSGAQAARSATGSTAQPQRSYKGSADERRSKTKTLVVTDVPSVLERVAEVIAALDVKPQQIRIEARFMEVNRDRLKDLGVDLATGSTGASTAAVETVSLDKEDGNVSIGVGGQTLGSLATPSAFGAKSSDISKTNPFNTGLSLAFQKLTGTQFNALLHALEEDIHTNTLSAPSIMTLDNQEANILVGTQYPILTSSVAGTTSTTTVTSLDYYQDIGIQLRVVPQIAGDGHINMIVHPAVTTFSSTLKAQNSGGFASAEYPIITTREAETQILMKNGDTIVIGGLLKDVETAGFHKIPLLGDIPILGWAFQRRTDDVEKIDLLIFITAEVFSEEQVASREPVFEPSRPGKKTTIQWHGTPPSSAGARDAKPHDGSK